MPLEEGKQKSAEMEEILRNFYDLGQMDRKE